MESTKKEMIIKLGVVLLRCPQVPPKTHKWVNVALRKPQEKCGSINLSGFNNTGNAKNIDFSETQSTRNEPSEHSTVWN